ncbi:MAG: FHA domain-containing protein [Coriobacteriales bacterium]|jgi:hypothetical protein|nr:FHA domain-containing protein [Coriobacteriales bacterium]
MKTCLQCGATAFDDMDVCFGCLNPFMEAGEDLELLGEVEEPGVLPGVLLGALPLPVEAERLFKALPDVGQEASSVSPACRVRVEFPGHFLYDTYIVQQDGASLRIGCAADNNIIIPQTEVGRHQLTLRYAQGQLWLEDHGSTHPALIDGIPLSGTRGVGEGVTIKVGDALLTLQTA